jgi:ABC-type bacteriocin/lantibiotic exporter with double-glycine peptidase domain
MLEYCILIALIIANIIIFYYMFKPIRDSNKRLKEAKNEWRRELAKFIKKVEEENRQNGY